MYLPQAIRTELEQEREHAAFLDLDLTIEDNIFVYKLFDKKGKFSFFLLYLYLLSRAIFHYQYSMVQYFQSSYK